MIRLHLQEYVRVNFMQIRRRETKRNLTQA